MNNQAAATARADEAVALARRFFDALERGDKGAVGSCYADHVEIWHNTDRVVQSKAENLAVLDGFFAVVKDRQYLDVRLDGFDGGFVQ